MLKKVLSLALLISGFLYLHAQQPTPLPLDPDVRHGVLPNGLNYYILHNEEPKERANFYIAQKVGSTLETPQQLGLAHFLEHMAFNGTKNYPGKNMLNYLQSKGIRFGSDINAYTAFDETVYNINNVPTTDMALMDSVLLVLHDWSGDILLEDAEIDAERGIIQEEWRSRNDASTRFFTKALPQIFQEYQYQQMPIGKMEVVMNFPYSDLRDYYKKWYRPDLQGIVIVGDFDAALMEEKVKRLFADIVMPEGAAERTYPSISDNNEPIYYAQTDPETQYSLTRIYFKGEKIPFEYRNTDMAFIQKELLENLISMMINNRLDELSRKPDCPFAYGGVAFSDFLVAKTKASFNVVAVAKGNNVTEATQAVMAEVARSCKTGFTDSELSRVKDVLLAGYEKAYNERNKTNNDSKAKVIIRHFIDNEPAPGMENIYNMVKQTLPLIPVQACNAVVKDLLTTTNQVITVEMPEKEGFTLPEKDAVIAAVNSPLSATYEAYVDEVITEPLIAKLPKKGKIKSTTQNAGLGTTEMVLSNGAKVIVKPTDFASDQIILRAVKKGGKDSYEPTAKNLNAMQLMEIAAETSKLGTFDNVKIQKYLAGKNISVTYGLEPTTTTVRGQSTIKDLPTLMECLYAEFTALNPDQQTFDATCSQVEASISNQDKNPIIAFQDSLYMSWCDNNPIFKTLSVKDIKNADYPYTLDLIKKSLANAADYTFIFVGNVDINTLKPLLEQYVATLPSKGKAIPSKVYPIQQTLGKKTNEFVMPTETPTVIAAGIWSGNNIENNVNNLVKIEFIGDILDNIYTRTLREEEGGVYSPYAGGSISNTTGFWSVLYQVQTNEEIKSKILGRADSEFKALLNNGATLDDFSKVKQAALQQYEINCRKNGYWAANLLTYYIFGRDMITGHKAAIQNLNLDEFNGFMKNLYDGKNELDVVLIGRK